MALEVIRSAPHQNVVTTDGGFGWISARRKWNSAVIQGKSDSRWQAYYVSGKYLAEEFKCDYWIRFDIIDSNSNSNGNGGQITFNKLKIPCQLIYGTPKTLYVFAYTDQQEDILPFKGLIDGQVYDTYTNFDQVKGQAEPFTISQSIDKSIAYASASFSNLLFNQKNDRIETVSFDKPLIISDFNQGIKHFWLNIKCDTGWIEIQDEYFKGTATNANNITYGPPVGAGLKSIEYEASALPQSGSITYMYKDEKGNWQAGITDTVYGEEEDPMQPPQQESQDQKNPYVLRNEFKPIGFDWTGVWYRDQKRATEDEIRYAFEAYKPGQNVKLYGSGEYTEYQVSVINTANPYVYSNGNFIKKEDSTRPIYMDFPYSYEYTINDDGESKGEENCIAGSNIVFNIPIHSTFTLNIDLNKTNYYFSDSSDLTKKMEITITSNISINPQVVPKWFRVEFYNYKDSWTIDRALSYTFYGNDNTQYFDNGTYATKGKNPSALPRIKLQKAIINNYGAEIILSDQEFNFASIDDTKAYSDAHWANDSDTIKKFFNNIDNTPTIETLFEGIDGNTDEVKDSGSGELNENSYIALQRILKFGSDDKYIITFGGNRVKSDDLEITTPTDLEIQFYQLNILKTLPGNSICIEKENGSNIYITNQIQIESAKVYHDIYVNVIWLKGKTILTYEDKNGNFNSVTSLAGTVDGFEIPAGNYTLAPNGSFTQFEVKNEKDGNGIIYIPYDCTIYRVKNPEHHKIYIYEGGTPHAIFETTK